MSDSTSKSVEIPINPADKRPLPEIVADHEGFPLSYLDHEDGQRYYGVQDWIVGVAKATSPRTLWKNMKRRLENAGVELLPRWQQLPYRATNGRTYQMDFAQAATLYQITQRMDANTGIRNKVLKFLAAAGVEVDEQRIDPEKAIDAGIEAYRRQGKSERWIEIRIQSKLQRVRFTSAFQNSQRQRPQPYHFAIITNEMRYGLWRRDTATLRKQMGLPKSANVKDHLSSLAIAYETLAEELSTVELESKRNLEFSETKTIVRSNGESVGKHAEEQGKRLGFDIATNHPLLSDHKD